MTVATTTSQGRVTIPRVVRDKLRLKAGDHVKFFLQDEGTALMVPATIYLAYFWGVLSAPAPCRPGRALL
ncbi:MAG: AbrB/MazE/SpoVT family DNA-binding domain-containing protein [Alphaproteobacteria bacterium]|jgi:AbrB family looped-hinge helix DNA binding protein|nr:AbrB family transcriptional regulator [Rhodospirillaceae bacterium]MDP6403821.1 AbrB/MazE/SpoVT family DNA-binding domain-containing protein [Alphaproteobacteria bacterium]MDP6622816.1 AbrB/MazE/SpoVT family DNA-binding domain-containing protein [Alphaproteobacteria bacterium]|tara:strand:- start:2239 stop:2448 length:210 start_codon:yes stop_codon:yes gene_type:complete